MTIASPYFRAANIVLLVYDVTERESFEYATEKFLNQVKKYSRSDTIVFLVGNKIDLESVREVSYDEGQTFVNQNGLASYIEVSSKTGQNVEKLFTQAVNHCMQRATSNEP